MRIKIKISDIVGHEKRSVLEYWQPLRSYAEIETDVNSLQGIINDTSACEIIADTNSAERAISRITTWVGYHYEIINLDEGLIVARRNSQNGTPDIRITDRDSWEPTTDGDITPTEPSRDFAVNPINFETETDGDLKIKFALGISTKIEAMLKLYILKPKKGDLVTLLEGNRTPIVDVIKSGSTYGESLALAMEHMKPCSGSGDELRIITSYVRDIREYKSGYDVYCGNGWRGRYKILDPTTLEEKVPDLSLIQADLAIIKTACSLNNFKDMDSVLAQIEGEM